MTDVSHYISVFRAHGNTEDRRKVTKRTRQTLSCVACRSKKLKCDRNHPCGNCQKRDESSKCTYSTGVASSGRKRDAEQSKSEVQTRLQKLEQMVSSLMQSGNNAKETISLSGSESGSDIYGDVGRLSVQESPNASTSSTDTSNASNHTYQGYAGATNWVAILEDIHHIQGYLEDNDNTVMEDTSAVPITTTVDVIFGPRETLTINEVMSALPPRHIVNQLLSTYFASATTGLRFIHYKKFHRECAEFWSNPSQTSFLWLSILFSLLALGTQTITLEYKIDNPTAKDIDAAFLIDRAGDCIVAGEYFKLKTYAVEALVSYAYCKFLQNRDADPGVWSTFGVATRLAQRMGYHRDPRHLSINLSPFESEMRRRTWLYVECFDLLQSFQVGLPPVSRAEQTDSETPGNYLETDLDEDMTSLPVPRPYSESTPILWYCYKYRLVKVLHRVSHASLAIERPPYEETMKIHQDLVAIYKQMPPSIKLTKDGSTTFLDNPETILQRLIVEASFQKSLCIIHRRYLSFEKENPKYDQSRKICREAALRVLDLQIELWKDTRVNGRLHGQGWVRSSLMLHDFLIAAMVICVDLLETQNCR
jgi:hypothetical protein